MKHSQLHSVAHNFADSLAVGISFIVGQYDLDVWGAAAANPSKSLMVDFLNGEVDCEVADERLSAAIPLFKNAFPEFCEKHGISSSDFTHFAVRYSVKAAGKHYMITIEDRRGRRSAREYVGVPGRKVHVLDDLGRRRPKPPPQVAD